MPKPKSKAFARIRAEVIRLVGLIPPGKFTTYGSIAVQMNGMARHVAFVMSNLTEQEAAEAGNGVSQLAKINTISTNTNILIMDRSRMKHRTKAGQRVVAFIIEFL